MYVGMESGYGPPRSLADMIDDGAFRQCDIDHHTAGSIGYAPGKVWIGGVEYHAQEIAFVTPEHQWQWRINVPFDFLAKETTVSDELLRACRTLYGNGPIYLIPTDGGHSAVAVTGDFPASTLREQVIRGVAKAPYRDVQRALVSLLAEGGHSYQEIASGRWRLSDGTIIDVGAGSVIGEMTLSNIVADGFYTATEAQFFQEASRLQPGPSHKVLVGHRQADGRILITHPTVQKFAVEKGIVELLRPISPAALPAVQRILSLWGMEATGENIHLFRLNLPVITPRVFDTVTATPVPPGVDAAAARQAYITYRGAERLLGGQTPTNTPIIGGGYVQQTQVPAPATTGVPVTPAAPIPPAPTNQVTSGYTVATPDNTRHLPPVEETRQIPSWAPTTPSAPTPQQSAVPSLPEAPAHTMHIPPVEETRQIPIWATPQEPHVQVPTGALPDEEPTVSIPTSQPETPTPTSEEPTEYILTQTTPLPSEEPTVFIPAAKEEEQTPPGDEKPTEQEEPNPARFRAFKPSQSLNPEPTPLPSEEPTVFIPKTQPTDQPPQL